MARGAARQPSDARLAGSSAWGCLGGLEASRGGSSAGGRAAALAAGYGIFGIAYLWAKLWRLPHNGVLVEVPVMLSLVAFANRTARYFPAAA